MRLTYFKYNFHPAVLHQLIKNHPEYTSFLRFVFLHSKQCNQFKTRAIKVKDALENGIAGITVLVNPEKVWLVSCQTALSIFQCEIIYAVDQRIDMIICASCPMLNVYVLMRNLNSEKLFYNSWIMVTEMKIDVVLPDVVIYCSMKDEVLTVLHT